MLNSRLNRTILVLAVGFASVVALPAGAAIADPEPASPPAAATNPYPEGGQDVSALQDLAFASGAIGLGYDHNTASVVALYPKGAALPRFGPSIAVRNAVVNRATVDRFGAMLKARTWASGANAYSYGYWVDAGSGRIRVETDAPGTVTEALARAFPGQLDVYLVGEAGRLTRQSDSAPHWGGASVTNGSSVCTSGFDVKNGSGTRFMVTAGHCFGSGNTIRSTGNSSFVWGTVVNRASFPTWDLELIGGGSYGSYIYTGDLTGTGTHVTSASDPIVNSTYCVSGQSTATTCNHTVSNLNASFCDASGCTPNVIAASGGGSLAGGDSGAPFYFPSGGQVYIRGVTFAKSGGTMYAEKWSTVANHFGVSIVT